MFISSFELYLFQVMFYAGRNIVVTIKQTLEDENITLVETSETKYPLAQCHIPEELIPRIL